MAGKKWSSLTQRSLIITQAHNKTRSWAEIGRLVSMSDTQCARIYHKALSRTLADQVAPTLNNLLARCDPEHRGGRKPSVPHGSAESLEIQNKLLGCGCFKKWMELGLRDGEGRVLSHTTLWRIAKRTDHFEKPVKRMTGKKGKRKSDVGGGVVVSEAEMRSRSIANAPTSVVQRALEAADQRTRSPVGSIRSLIDTTEMDAAANLQRMNFLSKV